MKGIYKIENIIDHKVYIGQTENFNRRIYLHLYYLRNGRHCNEYLQHAWDKYGEENFKIELFEDMTDISESEIHDRLGEREIYWINYYDSMNRDCGYNIASGGVSTKLFGESNANYGKPRSDEVKAKISETVKEKYRNGYVNPFKGKHLSEESKAKISKANKCRVQTDDEKARRAESMARWRNSDEYKELLERRKSDEDWQKRCAENGKKRRKYTDEFVATVRQAYSENPNMTEIAKQFNLRYKLCVEMINRNGHFWNR